MADLTIVATEVRSVSNEHNPLRRNAYPKSGTLTRGLYAVIDSSTAKAKVADASAAGTAIAGGIVVQDDGGTVSVQTEGLVDLGDALSSLAYGAEVYLSDTNAGILATTPGTYRRKIGKVVPHWANLTPNKLLQLTPYLDDEQQSHLTLVNDGSMDATPGVEGDLVYNLADNVVYKCTVTSTTAATWVGVDDVD